MEAPFTVIQNICKSAIDGKSQEIKRYFAEKAEIIVDEKNYNRKEFTDAVISCNCKVFSVEYLEIYNVPFAYGIATFFIRPEYQKVEKIKNSNRYHVEMTWSEINNCFVITKIIISKTDIK